MVHLAAMGETPSSHQIVEKDHNHRIGNADQVQVMQFELIVDP
jgi:hypothetical protein